MYRTKLALPFVAAAMAATMIIDNDLRISFRGFMVCPFLWIPPENKLVFARTDVLPSSSYSVIVYTIAGVPQNRVFSLQTVFHTAGSALTRPEK